MITNEKKIDELLSAYIDGELSPEESEELTQKIKSSLELQKKLEDLKKIKEQVSSNYPALSESPYFETRLFAELKNQNRWFQKAFKLSPAIGLAMITVILMVVLRFNPQLIDNLIEQQTSNIAGFYKENLQPLLFAADLNNEDIFNFAMYKQLPLNKEDKQVLHLGHDAEGKEFIEIKNADESIEDNNYEKFVVALDLNELQKIQIDSIINQYAEELETQILVDINNTVAINSNLWNYQRAIQSDLLSFAEKTNEMQFHKLMPGIRSVSSAPEVVKAVSEFRKTKNKNYIILTPDSIFAESIDFEPEDYALRIMEREDELEKIKEKLNQVKINFNYDSSWKNSNTQGWQNHFNIIIDSNRCRVDISEIHIPEIHIPDFDSIFSIYDSMANNFKYYSQYIPKIQYFDNKIKFDFNTDSAKSYEFEVYDFDMDSLMNSQFNMIDSIGNFNFNRYLNFNDSMVFRHLPKINSYFKFYDNDLEIQVQMEELKKELEKFREEMKDWRFEFKDQRSSNKKERRNN